MKFFNDWYLNVIIAVVAAVCGILQEIWLDSEPSFISALAFGGIAGVLMSIVTEIGKLAFIEQKWSHKSVIAGAVAGVLTALVTAIVVC